MSVKMKQSQNKASDSTDKKGLYVAPSPLNGVKLDLGLFILFGFVLFMVLENINISQGLRFLLLGCWALLMLVWVVVKTRAIIKKTSLQGNLFEQAGAEEREPSREQQTGGEATRGTK